jgi:hypothetical protein
MFNANLVDTINIFLNKNEILGYRCVYDEQAIFKDGNIIDTKNELKSHSPLGLSWGYNGSGSRQTTLAILCDFTKDEDFNIDVIVKLPLKDCVIKYSEIQHWVDLRRIKN